VDGVAQGVSMMVLLGERGEHTSVVVAMWEGTVTVTVGMVRSESKPLGGVGRYPLKNVGWNSYHSKLGSRCGGELGVPSFATTAHTKVLP